MYTFEKAGKIRLNNRNLNVYEVWQTELPELTKTLRHEEQTIQTCECPGFTVVTGEATVIRGQDAKILIREKETFARVFVTKVYAKNEKEAKEIFHME